MPGRSDRDDDRYEDDRPARRRPRDRNDDERPSRRGRSRRDDDDDRPARRSDRKGGDDDERARKWAKNAPGLGIMALVTGLMVLLGSLIPCMGVFAIFPAVALGLPVSIMGLVAARKSKGRVGGGMAIAGISLSSVAIVIALVWMAVMRNLGDGPGKSGGSEQAEVKNGPGTKGQPPIRITAAELHQAYKDDAAAANRKYADRTVEITGRVTRVEGGRRPTDRLVMDLRGVGNGTVNCFFESDPTGELRNIPIGSEVRIRGQSLGHREPYIMIDRCTLLEFTEPKS